MDNLVNKFAPRHMREKFLNMILKENIPIYQN